MNPYAFSGFLAGISSPSFGLLVLLKSSNSKLARRWFIFSISVALWGFIGMWATLADRQNEALIAWRLALALSVIWIPVLFYNFVCIFCNLHRRLLIITLYLIGTLFLFMSPTPLLYADVRLAFNSILWPVPGSLYGIFALWWFLVVIYSHYELYHAYQQVSLEKRNQIKYFFLATAIGFGGGSFDYLPTFKIDAYPWGNFAIFFYPIIMSYAILKYRLMDISIVLKRAGLIALIYVGLAVVLIPVAQFSYPFLASSKWGYPVGVPVCSTILSIGPFLYAYLIRKSAFFQERVVSGVTHEFKSPLAAIQSAAAILMEEISGGKSLDLIKSKFCDYVLMIQNNSQRLEKFIENLLEVAKIEQSREWLKVEQTNLKEMCEKIMELYKPLTQQRQIQLKLTAKDIKPTICDPEKIQMVVSNLVSNAIKFTCKGSVEIKIEDLQRETIVSIQDTGAGIAQEELSKIFDKFYKSGSKGENKGTGLGLSIAKGWVEAHGGRIWVESGGFLKGTKVFFTLPNEN